VAACQHSTLHRNHFPRQTLLKLFGAWIQFFYFSFDRVVLHGYLSCFQHQGHVVACFRNLLGAPVLTTELRRQRTEDDNPGVAAFARKQNIPLLWAPPGQRKEDLVRTRLENGG
jgi:hypothetical protein